KIIKTWVAVGVFGLALGLAITARETSDSFKQCIADHRANKTSEQQIESPAGFVPALFWRGVAYRCTGMFLDKNDTGVAAVATVALALFTFTLWHNSRKQLDTARDIERA